MPSITIPSDHFRVLTDTGANILSTAQAAFPGNYLLWIKDRGNANNHQLIDTVRGASAVLQSNSTGAETTYSAPAGSSVAWVWKAGGAAVSNTAGSITSQVSANTAAGFSVVTYTGTGANATVGHGLGVAPKMVIVKARGSADPWVVYHANQNASPATGYLLLNTTAAFVALSTVWNNTAPTSSVIALGAASGTNNTVAMVAYCFAEVPSFSRFGSYTGNGSSDGPFVFCGFRPKYVLIKRTDTPSNWVVFDSARDDSNVVDLALYPNLAASEGSGTRLIDFTSNGFKSRGTDSDHNTNAGTYIYMAFAESPFKYSNAR